MTPALLQKKLIDAKKALKNNFGYFTPDSIDLVDELMDLNIDQSEELWPLLIELLEEIEPKNYLEAEVLILSSSKSKKPPGCEFFAFAWKSKILKGLAKLKFALNSGNFYYLSLRAAH